MIAGPVFAGAVQLTVKPPAVMLEIVGADGADGASPPTFVTVTVIVWSAVIARSPSPPVALTTTMYSLFPAALAGSVLAASFGASKFGALLKVRAPAPVMSNLSWSARRRAHSR